MNEPGGDARTDLLAAPPAIAVVGVSKQYGATLALDDVSFELPAGEIHCLLGENGAGKSTLVKIIAGLEVQDRGTLAINGIEVADGGVAAARAAGVGVVYQHPVVFPDIDVTENIYAGRPILRSERLPIVDTRRMRDAVRKIFRRMDVRIDPATRMGDLSTGERQLVEIAKALSEDISILVLDEPTAALPEKEVASLFSIVRRLAAGGVAILFISHRLDEVFEIGDRVTVLRDGRRVATEPVSALTKDDLIRMMVGHGVEASTRKNAELGTVALEVRDWSRRGIFSDVSFSLHRGEILGFAGLVGSGGSGVARALFGIDRSDKGSLKIAGRPVTPRSPRQMMRHGLAFVPEDRQGAGLVMQWRVFSNITLPILGRIASLGMFPRPREEALVAGGYVDALDVRPNRVAEFVSNLSGGNQQKVLLSKWLATNPGILILEDPTAGIDIGAKTEVHRVIDRLAGDGLAIIIVSSDMVELLSVAHRILVFAGGRVAADVLAADTSREFILHAATGGGAKAPETAAGHGPNLRTAP
jgi:rhamnose transport system ATP-binding protein